MNTVLPAPRTTPSASCVRSTTSPVSSSACFRLMGPRSLLNPRSEELVEMRLPRLGQPGAGAAQLLVQRWRAQAAAHQLEPQEDQPRVDHVRLTVAADARELASLIGVPYLGAI